MLRGVRGAITVEENVYEQIMDSVSELLGALVEENSIDSEEVGAVIFSSTPDLDAAFPAAAARKIGWADVPLFGTQEIEVVDKIKLCVRVLILWNTDKPQKEIKHLYLRDAVVLRPDIARTASPE